MGEFRFSVPDDWNLDPYHSNAIHIVGLDGVPWPCRISLDGESDGGQRIFTVIQNREESGRIYVIYPFTEWGELLICTATLPVADRTYCLLTELARGTLNRLRNQISIWQEGGLERDARIDGLVIDSTQDLGQAIQASELEHRVESAKRSLDQSMSAIFDLGDIFGQQVSKFRRENDNLSTFWLANSLEQEDLILKNAAHELFDLSEICNWNVGESESGKEPVKRKIEGPWLDASQGGMRTEIVDQQGFENRKSRLLVDCRRQLENLSPATSLLHVVSGLNGIGHRDLSYPQQLQVTIDLLRLVEDSLVETPTMISFDFPWGERLAGSVGGVHPLQIADSLMRQGLPISFLGLDINLDYWPNGSALRDPLQWIDLVDVWAQLGLPLVLCLRAPSGVENLDVDDGMGKRANRTPGNLTDIQRVRFLETILPMMVARPSVHGMIWRQWQDQDDPRYPGAGLVDLNGNLKPMGQALSKMRSVI